MFRTLVVVVVAFLAASCHGWNYKTQSTFGPSRWSQYFPMCDPTTRDQSPIAFTTAERTATQATDYTWSFHRLIASATATAGINFETSLNTGGLLHAYPLSAFAMTLRKLSSTTGALINQSTVYLLEIAYHAGTEHTGALSDSTTGEIQYLFGDSAGGSPTLMFAQPLVASATATVSADTSVTMTLLSQLNTYLSPTQAGASTINYITPQMPYLFFNNSNTFSTKAIMYEGTTSWPPCSPVRVVVSLTRALIPTTLFATIYSASGKSSTARPAQNRSSSTSITYVQILQGNALDASNTPQFTPAPTQYVDVTIVRSVPNPHNEYMMDAIIGLVALNGVLILGIVTLLLARWEVIEWPMWLGGLRRPVEWWTNPQSTGADGDDEEDDEEEEGEEGEEDEEREHEDAEEDEQALRAHAA